MNITNESPYRPAPAHSGHRSDGSGIQNHSVGSHFPYVVGYRQRMFGLSHWFVQSPDGSVVGIHDTAEHAMAQAEQLAMALRARDEGRRMLRDRRVEIGLGPALRATPQEYLAGMQTLVDEYRARGEAYPTGALCVQLRQLAQMLTEQH